MGLRGSSGNDDALQLLLVDRFLDGDRTGLGTEGEVSIGIFYAWHLLDGFHNTGNIYNARDVDASIAHEDADICRLLLDGSWFRFGLCFDITSFFFLFTHVCFPERYR